MTLDRALDVVDDWAHDYLPDRLHRIFFGWLCDWRDARLRGQWTRDGDA